ncbi:hypothetical protein GCM10011390_13500 [Aureimonas endophytica]|uniref:DUF427 domain-containing protein n=1 Tax=Aureimonas endophytica TaxID=2027858 RepID=A0A917E2B9_9HYPH|nr:DUF427 domain-containing protein [Aureimonas endophytica]GGD96070.1 hypothetical protein GCM10011390_13500 [Aureimonas endophytica]
MSAAGTRPRITIEPEARPVIVLMNDNIIASTKEALILTEGDHPPVYYIPREHVAMEFLIPTDHHTTCPWKGEARYWTITGQGRAVENGAWAYDNPHAEVSAIAGHLAFYPDRLRIEVG